MIKYPKTKRLEKVLKEDLSSWKHLKAVVSEKVDGANVGISFNSGKMTLQSRGHILRGGAREKLFTLFKSWSYEREIQLHKALDNRYLLFGEWC